MGGPRGAALGEAAEAVTEKESRESVADQAERELAADDRFVEEPEVLAEGEVEVIFPGEVFRGKRRPKEES
jgi:hypothetical protein